MPAGAVVLVHGLWMTGLDLLWLRRRLASDFGLSPTIFRYRTTREPIDVVVDRLRELIERTSAAAARVHLVGHSLGGLVLLRLFERHPDLACGRAVLLGSPVNGSLAARALNRMPLGNWLVGAETSSALLAALERRCDSARHEIGVIAGSQSLGLGRLLAQFDEPNDGTVAVRETEFRDARDRVVLPVSHFGMLMSPRVAREIGTFLRDGRFSLRVP